MFHSRALLAPAILHRDLCHTGFSHIVHVDDHDDLMPPLIALEEGILVDPLSVVPIDLDNVGSINTAIEREVISKGSFLGTYVIAKPAARVIHVRRNSKPRVSWLLTKRAHRTIGSVEVATDFVVFSDSVQPSAWCWEEVGALPLELENCESVWLDVDLDAFCNRYDGDSNRSDAVATDSEKITLRKGVEDFLHRLSSASWRDRIDAVSLAASPGFFPSEYWGRVIPHLSNGIASIVDKT